jgi:hypothetical protein
MKTITADSVRPIRSSWPALRPPQKCKLPECSAMVSQADVRNKKFCCVEHCDLWFSRQHTVRQRRKRTRARRIEMIIPKREDARG